MKKKLLIMDCLYLIRKSKRSDTPLLKKIFEEIFHDSIDFIDILFSVLYDDNVWLYEIEEQIVAMAFELKASLLINHKEHNVSYIYACGTLKKFRGKSLMKQILEKIYIEACQADKAAVILLPASDSLYSYYENLGFQKFFYQNKSRIESSKKHLSKQKNIYHISKTNATIYSSLRKQHLLADYTIHYPNSHFQVLDELFAHEPQQGFFLISKEKKVIGFCFIEKTEETLYLKELYLFEPFSDTLYQLFFEQFQVRQIELTMPLSFENDQNQPSALIRWNPRFLPQKKSRGYFNFGLE